MEPKFEVYEKVWIMANNLPIKKIVFAVVQSMDKAKTGVEITYHLVTELAGTGWGNNEGMIYKEEIIFKTKDELIKSLYF